jgi:hypothetical protein
MKFLTNDSYKLLQDELAFWRQAYERERDRADRLQDSILQNQGLPPVSEPGRSDVRALAKKRAGIADSLKELFSEEMGQLELTDEEKSELNVLGKAVENAPVAEEVE